MTHRILVFGGREYAKATFVYGALDLLYERFGMFIIIEGGAEGADSLAKAWAKLHGRPYAEVPADWDFHKKAAGAIRNSWMALLQPTRAVGFPGGTGTADMYSKLERLHIPIWLPEVEDPPIAFN